MSQNILVVASISALLLLLTFSEISANECGTVEFIDPKIIRGTQTVRGAWPFLGALYYIEQSKFFCGSTLISAKNVLTGRLVEKRNSFKVKLNRQLNITAAHCVQNKYSALKLAPEGLFSNSISRFF